MQPLEGIRILAVEQMQSLPSATQLLARLGADVVKVEHPTRGDLGRGSTPAATDADGRPVGGTYLRNNCSKRSIALDLKNPEAKRVFLDLVPRYDIVCENFKPGTMVKFGLDYETLRAAHPSVIFLSLSGFGNTLESPYGHWPAYAPIAESMAGLYSINRPDDEPLKVSPVGALGDTGSGLFAAVGLLAALRHRDNTGEGTYVDIAMYDCMVSFADMVPNYWSMGKDPRTPTEMINNGFPIDNGGFVIQIGREHQFERLTEVLGTPEWLDDPRFATRAGWLEHLDVIREEVRVWAGNRSMVEAADALAAAGIAASPVFEASDVVADPHVRQRNMLSEIPRVDGVEQPVLTPGNPVKLSTVPDHVDTPPPDLGQHTDEILTSELGLDPAELTRLRELGAIG